eukprot:PITA_32414
MVSEQRIRDRKGKPIMGQDHNAEASTSGDSCRFSKNCTRDKNSDFSMLASRLEEEVACVASSASSGVWYIDSGASWHMTGIWECFSDYQEERITFQITIGNEAKCTLVGKGTIVFQTETCERFRATNVLHEPGLGMNLLSVSQLQSKGYDVLFIKEKEESQEEEELTDAPTTRGRTSQELRQILRDAEDFIGAPHNNKRERRERDRYQALVAQDGDPSSFQEAAQHQVWMDAMVEEYNSIMVNDVWEVVPRLEDRSVVGLRWIYKIKYTADDNVEKYNAKFVAKGYAQKGGIDYEETFTPVARYTSIRTMISIAA